MNRSPLAPALAAGLALALPLAIVGVVAASAGPALWLALDWCASLGATATSLPALLAGAVALSMLTLALGHAAQQALLSGRTVRIARSLPGAGLPDDVALRARRLGIPRLVVVGVDERLACCAGLWRPTVIVSRGLVEDLSPEALEAVLAHEAAHARGRDPLRQVVAHAAARGLWMLPLARVLAAHQHLALELHADDAAVRRAGRRPLIQALMELHAGPVMPTGPGVAGGASLLGQRLDALSPGVPGPRLAVSHGVALRTGLGLGSLGLLMALAAAAPLVGTEHTMAMGSEQHDVPTMVLAWILRAAVLVALALAVRSRLPGRCAPWGAPLRRRQIETPGSESCRLP